MIIDHGIWELYAPATPPSLHTILYAHRATPEQEDWYAYQTTFAAGSVIMTVQQLEDGTEVVQAVTHDPSTIFPAGFRVIEENAYVGTDAFSDFNHHMYDPNTQTIGAVFVPPDPPATRVEQRILKALDMIVERIERLEKGEK